MTRSELIARLATHFAQLTAKDVELSVKAILEGMSEALARGDRIEVRGFGSFTLNYRPPRNGRNPKTGVVVEVPAKRVPHFTPGKRTTRTGRVLQMTLSVLGLQIGTLRQDLHIVWETPDQRV